MKTGLTNPETDVEQCFLPSPKMTNVLDNYFIHFELVFVALNDCLGPLGQIIWINNGGVKFNNAEVLLQAD